MAVKPEVRYEYKNGEDRMLHRCPTCRRLISTYEFGYSSTLNGLPEERRIDCPSCGQEIDWSDVPWQGEHDIFAGTYGKSRTSPPALRAPYPCTGEALGAAQGSKKRLIDADALERSFELSARSWGRDCNSNAPVISRTYEEALSRVKYAPTVDAVEVVHGRWEYVAKSKDVKSGYKCSVCYGPVWHAPDVPQAFLYCPNCGAKMDGGDGRGGGTAV